MKTNKSLKECSYVVSSHIFCDQLLYDFTIQTSQLTKPNMHSTYNLTDFCYSTQEFGKIIGVVGAATSAVSIQLASFLRLFKIPQVRLRCLYFALTFI